MIHEGTITNGRHRVLLDESTASVLVEASIGDEWMVVMDARARNLRMLSEWLSDQVGYDSAVELLTSWNIPRESPLWVLHHKAGGTHWVRRR